jgi:hypothetical protein
VPVACGTDAVELIAYLRDSFSVVGLGREIGLVGGFRQLLDVEVHCASSARSGIINALVASASVAVKRTRLLLAYATGADRILM